MRINRKLLVPIAIIALPILPQLALPEGIILAEQEWSGGNGNTYVVVQFPAKTWDESSVDMSVLLPGYHLATITSQAEQDFIDDLLINQGLTSQFWLGGYQVTSKPETDPAAGWQWVTNEPWAYTNWGSSEPNNAGGFEDHLTTTPFLGWNDEGSAVGAVFGYLAESENVFPYIGSPVPGIILNTQLAVGSAGTAGVIQTGGLLHGVEAFVDRWGQQWQGIPLQLIGADFIQTAQNNADVSPIAIEVTVLGGTILHMLVPEHDDLLPFSWMNYSDFGADWVNTGAVINTSWSSPAQVWSTITPLPAGTYTFRGLPTDLSFYGIAATQAEQISVLIDIKPGSDRNPVNLRSKGNIPVAILTSDSFDATQVNWETVQFGPSGATERHQRVHVKDVDYDGDIDVVLHFKTRDTGTLCGDTEATLTGETFSGEEFTGSDVIKIVKCPKKKRR